MQEDPQTTVTTKPDWISYFIQDPKTKQWVHTTLFRVSAGATVNVTVLGYDGCTPSRNPFWGKVTGTIGNTETVDGKTVRALDTGELLGRAYLLDPRYRPQRADGIADDVQENNNLCTQSPCTSGPKATMTVQLPRPTTPGAYFWQCRIPCGGGFVTGFGGPMQTIGFMTGKWRWRPDGRRVSAAAPAAGRRPLHGMRIFCLWIVVSVVADLLIGFVLAPHLPPGNMSSAAHDEQGAITTMALMSAPVVAFVLIYFGYALVVWRQPRRRRGGRAAAAGPRQDPTAWIAVTSVIVLALAVFGTVELVDSHGAGAGEGPAPIWKPPAPCR